jgi:hypothetical protein
MSITPETTNYMIGGFAAFFIVFGVYLTSLVVRWNKLMRDQETLAELEKSKKA